MSDEVVYLHASGGLVAPALLNALRRERSSDPLAAPASFALRDTELLTARDLDAEIGLALGELSARWDTFAAELDGMDTSRLRERWLIPLLGRLGFEPQFLRGGLAAGGARFDISHLGWKEDDAPPLLLTTAPLDAGKPSPHDRLQSYLNASEDHRWGVLANGRRLRVLRDFHHRRVRGYVEFDLDAIFEARSYPDFLAFYRVCHASRFVAVNGDEPLEELHRRSLDAGVAIGRRLRPQVQRALERIANGVSDADLRADLADPSKARAFHRELLVLLYRLLFLLFAERRGLLPGKGLYAESYSVSRLRALAGQPEHTVEPRRGDLWEGLKVTFRALTGDGAHAIGAFPFNGPLFEEARAPLLSAARCDNRTLLRAIRDLTTIELEGTRQYVNFADLGVEEIGSVYESLLDYLPVVGPGGRIELSATSEERSDLGSYYTPQELVDLVLSKSLDRVIDERLAQADEDPVARERALLDITVIDPACGSAAFLIAAVDRLALRLAEVRRDGAPDEHDLRVARRDVLAHCIYAVDKDETAVELAKVALWIHCAVEDRPLTFLDHRIQHGDSLVGWPLLGKLPNAIPAEAYAPHSRESSAEKRERRAWSKLNDDRQLELGATPPPAPEPSFNVPPELDAHEDSPDAIHAKADAHDAWRASPEVQRLERAANLWTAAFFWSADAGIAPSSHEYWKALAGEPVAQAEEADRLATQVPYFHWALRFPEIRARGGFDCVIGNPPWEQYKVDQREWFASRNPEVAALPGAQREAAIRDLADSDPELHAAWRRNSRTIDRMGQWARTCGRFTPSGAEANTYLLFAEHDADILAPNGRAGVLLKSQLALDRSASGVFRRLVDSRRLEEFHDIVNGGPTGTNLVFPNVDAKERVAIVAFAAGSHEADGFDATVMNWNVEEAASRMPRRVTPAMLATLNPRTRTFTSFRRNEELEVALAIHERVGTLDLEPEGQNPWELSYVRLFDAKGDSDKFLRREELEPQGWQLGADKIFRHNGDVALPLYEGQLINRYDHRARTYDGFAGANKYGRAPGIPITAAAEKRDPSFEIEPRYWMAHEVVAARYAARVGDRVACAFRAIGAPWRNQRISKAALIPVRPATHMCPVLAVPPEKAFEFLAVWNSCCFDFLVRGHTPGGNLALTWMLSQIAAPEPGLDPRIARHARKLSLTSYSVAALFDVEPHIWDPADRYALDVETDALVAHEYGLDHQAYEIVLSSFEVMQREQIRQHGYYKLKEDCLAAFDRIAGERRQPEEETVGRA